MPCCRSAHPSPVSLSCLRLQAEALVCSTASARIIQRHSCFLQELIEKTAKEIYDHEMQSRVVLGNPFSAGIRDKCREAVPEALTLLLVSEVGLLKVVLTSALSKWPMAQTCTAFGSQFGQTQAFKAKGANTVRIDMRLLVSPFRLWLP